MRDTDIPNNFGIFFSFHLNSIFSVPFYATHCDTQVLEDQIHWYGNANRKVQNEQSKEKRIEKFSVQFLEVQVCVVMLHTEKKTL